MTRDRRPPRLTGGMAVGAAGLAALLVGGPVPAALPLGVLGIALVALAVSRGRERAAHAGLTALILAVIVAGVTGAPAGLTLPAVAAALLSWDLAQQAVGLGEQVGRDATTARGETVHAAASTTVAVGSVGVGALLYELAAGASGSLTALVFLVVAVLVLASQYRD